MVHRPAGCRPPPLLLLQLLLATLHAALKIKIGAAAGAVLSNVVLGVGVPADSSATSSPGGLDANAFCALFLSRCRLSDVLVMRISFLCHSPYSFLLTFALG